MLKILLLIVLLFFAIGIAMALLTRLTRTQQKIADLHRDLRRTDGALTQQRQQLERLAAQQEAEKSDRDVKS
jgi:cell division protein FtsB